MAIRQQQIPSINQVIAGDQSLQQQAFSIDANLRQAINQIGPRLADKFVTLLERARQRRFEESQASKSRKAQRLGMGIAAGSGAAFGGITGGLGLIPGITGLPGALIGAGLGGSLGTGLGTIGGAFAGIPQGLGNISESIAANQPINPAVGKTFSGGETTQKVVEQGLQQGTLLNNPLPSVSGDLGGTLLNQPLPSVQQRTTTQPTVDLGAPVSLITPEELDKTVRRAAKDIEKEGDFESALALAEELLGRVA